MTDPLDKQLVEAVLTARPRRTKRETEEVKLASARPRKGAVAAVEVDGLAAGEDPDADLEDDLDLDPDAEPDAALLSAEADEPGAAELSIELVGEVALEGVPVPAGVDAPPGL